MNHVDIKVTEIFFSGANLSKNANMTRNYRKRNYERDILPDVLPQLTSLDLQRRSFISYSEVNDEHFRLEWSCFFKESFACQSRNERIVSTLKLVSRIGLKLEKSVNAIFNFAWTNKDLAKILQRNTTKRTQQFCSDIFPRLVHIVYSLETFAFAFALTVQCELMATQAPMPKIKLLTEPFSRSR